MSVKYELFGTMTNGRKVEKYIIENINGCKVSVITLGATLTEFILQDKNKIYRDIALGFDNLDGYLNEWDYQGATVGPVANRIGNAEFTMDCKKYKLTINEKDRQMLHSNGEFNNAIWNAEIINDKAVLFTLETKDGENGLPGNKTVKVTYLLDNDNALHIIYTAVSDKKTPFSITNHSYFNLNGYDGENIYSHKMKLNCSNYTPVDEYSIPTGEIVSVKNSPFDFTDTKEIGKNIDDDFIQLKLTGGYDHNFCIDNYDGKLKLISETYEEKTGFLLETYTDLPGVQFYAGNFLKGVKGKNNKPMNYRCGFCLETQYYPDSVNHPNFPDCIFDKGQEFKSETIYKISVK